MRFTSIGYSVIITPSTNESIQVREIQNWQEQIDNFIQRSILRKNNVDATVDVLIDPLRTKEE